MNEHRDRPQNFALIKHEQVVEDITSRYIEGPTQELAAQDARKYFESKLNYSKTKSDDFIQNEIIECEEALVGIDKNDWAIARRIILRTCMNFIETQDEELEKTGIAFANLASSLPMPYISLKVDF